MRKKHHSVVAIIIAGALAGACMVAGCSVVKNKDIERITGKDAAGRIERIKEKAEKAADKTGKVAEKIRRFTDRVIEKAGGTEEISRKIKSIIAGFAEGRKLKSVDDIDLTALDSYGYAYRFTYDGEKYRAVYTASCETWTIYDSCKITNGHDMTIICQALIDIHPVHGSDFESYRTADDMAYEWQQHNIVYELLPDGNRWKSSAKDVDLDPYDQGKSYKEIYEDRTGREFDIKNFV